MKKSRNFSKNYVYILIYTHMPTKHDYYFDFTGKVLKITWDSVPVFIYYR